MLYFSKKLFARVHLACNDSQFAQSPSVLVLLDNTRYALALVTTGFVGRNSIKKRKRIQKANRITYIHTHKTVFLVLRVGYDFGRQSSRYNNLQQQYNANVFPYNRWL